MAKYIDIDKAKETKVYIAERHEYIIPVANLDWLSPADVQEVKHGKWNYYTKTNVICSCCNFIRNIETQIAWEFCPKCGTKMDLED